jgi:hypothetical protein
MTFFARAEVDVHRVTLHGQTGDSKNGAFDIKPKGLHVIASSGMGWEHVSISRRKRVPEYYDLKYCKDLFWSGEDCVMQFFPPQSVHVNCHPYCLHLWRPTDHDVPTPPTILLGPE